MPLPDALSAAVRVKRFWTDFLWMTDAAFPEEGEEDERDYPAFGTCHLVFPAGPHAVTLTFDDMHCSFSLGLLPAGEKEPVQIGWDDQTHWHPHVLRWDELDLLCRCAALTDPSLAHPGPPLLLLHRFAPICVGDDVDMIHPLLESAWRSLGLLSDAELSKLIEGADRRPAGFTWRRHDQRGWSLHQSEEDELASECGLYTLRNGENEEFPFAAWNELIAGATQLCERAVRPEWRTWDDGTVLRIARRVADTGDLAGAPVLANALEEAGCDHPTILQACRPPVEAARACWVVELLLGAERGSVIRRHFGPTKHKQRTVYRLSVTVPTLTRTFVLPSRSGTPFASAVDRALGAQDLGGAQVTGSSSTQNQASEEIETSDTVSVRILDDLERGLRVVREALLQAQAPPGTVIRVTHPRRTIPLYPDTNG
jgi:hypothetical protein